MVDFNLLNKGMNSTSYMTPIIGSPAAGAIQRQGMLAQTAPDQKRTQEMTTHMFNTRYDEESGVGVAERVAKFVGAAGIDMADMVISATPLTERGDIWREARDLGLNGLANFAERNKDGVALTSGIVASVVTGGLAEAYLVPVMASRLAAGTALSSTRLWQSGAKFLGGARAAALDSSYAAAMAGEVATVLGTVGGRQLLRNRVLGGIGSAAVGETAIYAVTRTNESLWSDDAATNLMMAGLGLGIGGVLGGITARSEMRQIANSEEMMRVRADASDPYSWGLIREGQPDKEFFDNIKGAEYKESYLLTGLQLQARQQVPEGVTGTRANLLTQESIQAGHQALESLQKITTKGVELVPGTSLNLNAPANAATRKHLIDTLHDDPTAMLGIDSLGGGNFGANVDARKAQIKLLKESRDVKDIRKARSLEEQESLMLVGKSWMPDSKDARDFANFTPAKVKLTPTSKAAGHYEFKLDIGEGRIIKVNEGGNIPRFQEFTISQRLKAIDGLNQVAAKMISNNVDFILPKNPTWLQIDFAENFAKKGGKVDVTTAAGFKDIDSALMESLRLKANEALKMSKSGKFDYWDRLKLNLPLPSSLERIHDGSGDTLINMLNGVLKNPKMTVSEAKEIRANLLQAKELRTGIKQGDIAVHGDLFNFNRTPEGVWQPPVTAYASYNRVTPELIGTRDHLIIGTAEVKAFRANKLREGILSKEITERLLTQPEFEVASSLRGLADDQITGVGSNVSQGLGSALTREHRYRDSKTMLAAFRVRETVDRATDNYINNLMKTTFGGIQDQLASVPNRGSKTLVDQFFSVAGGYDLKPGALRQADGTYAFELAETARNEARLGRAVTPGESLINPATGKGVVVDSLGLEYIGRFQIAAAQVRRDTNAVRAARNLEEIGSKTWFVPSPSTKGKIVGFTIDVNGKTVPGGAIIASTQEEFDALRKAKEATLQPGQKFYTKTEIESTADLWDRAEMDWVDPGIVAGRSAGQRGALFGNQVNANALEDSLQWVVDRVKQVSDGAVRSMFDQQLAIARARAATEEVTHTGGKRRTIWDEWEATILGKPLSGIKSGPGTRIVNSVEEGIQTVIDSSWPAMKAVGATQMSQWLSDLSHRLGMKGDLKGVRSFEDLANKLGPHMPYNNVSEYLQQTMRVSVPPEVREISSGINRFTASMLLRWLEFPNAVMNMLGVVTNMPSILRSPTTPLIGTLTANGKKIGVVDSYKILASGFADMLAGSKHAEWDFMVRNGDTTQSIAELNKQLSLIDSKTGFQRVLMGDSTVNMPNRIPRKLGDTGKFVKSKGIDGLVSLATDTTESMSRAWSHFVGLRLADMNGIVGQEARHSFARSVANQAIANYNPLNKPELYQTSIGSMFGLFASYMQAYNQRMFRWLELGDYRSVGRQVAMQSLMFGTASVPGYNALEWLFEGMGNQPDATITDAVYAKYGPQVGSVIAHGGIQELPKIFGMDEAIALYSRGDANFRSPTLDPTRLMAGLNVVKGVTSAIWEVGSKAVDPNSDLSMRAVTETIARNLPNRAMKGSMNVILHGGKDTDPSGAVIAETQTSLETGLRMLGLRSSRQQGEVEAYYANTTQRRRLAARMETLREDTRVKIRSGEPFNAMETFNEYVRRGGSPTHFQTWIQDQLKAANNTRGTKQFVESLKSPTGQLEAWRYQMRQ